MKKSVAQEISKVVRNGNCSGCGGCAQVFQDVSMEIVKNRFLRPSLGVEKDYTTVGDVMKFRSVCPGIGVHAPVPVEDGMKQDSIFGPYISAWVGWASDEEFRNAGSSGGVLTALSAWMVEKEQTAKVVGTTALEGSTRSTSTNITSRKDALSAAGSRYAPVANLPLFVVNGSSNALVGKPCEISSARAIMGLEGGAVEDTPFMMSFFCAGVPSQSATDVLVENLGVNVKSVTSLRYRGAGWPGEFAVQDAGGNSAVLSYSESWGAHLGKDLQWRCKLCPDGTGRFADVSVGDYWESDANGFPVFDTGDGRSFIFARTARGHQSLMDAAADGVLLLESISHDVLYSVQPLQVTRVRTLFGRLLGRLLSGHRIPTYRGFALSALARQHFAASSRAALGTFRRSWGRSGNLLDPEVERGKGIK
ncbi:MULTISPECIES: Coenzyme F420 hydrogenase/dehydrogenase, beta subunit C-terminal domain [unclassified Rhodococcus (in: high G+C Gram-positive bacteria)]|uniref:Coenzyme F420 hydrogenase/dehydrogenase, beta subunit C-terminal domain n=1 Tax=unclassified Rhodococcus (in: high G+C Gram-positive bacteria) TaxID=192944 RepID=UPI003391FF79